MRLSYLISKRRIRCMALLLLALLPLIFLMSSLMLLMLWLILCRAVVRGNQVIAVDSENRNHYGAALWSKLLHQRTAVCRQRINHMDFNAVVLALPLAFERHEAIKRFLAFGLVRCRRSRDCNQRDHADCQKQ